jgi:hypothetical protein
MRVASGGCLPCREYGTAWMRFKLGSYSGVFKLTHYPECGPLVSADTGCFRKSLSVTTRFALILARSRQLAALGIARNLRFAADERPTTPDWPVPATSRPFPVWPNKAIPGRDLDGRNSAQASQP